MLFAQTALAPGPQACFFAEKATVKVKEGQGIGRIEAISFL
jgi:hypothetical protein